MKKLFFLLLLFSTQAYAKTYFLSNDGDDTNSGTSETTPLKTIGKLNELFSSLQAGDKILFKRGDTFYGQLVISKSGTQNNKIIISAYGTGAKPIITGFTPVSGWEPVGGGIWESASLPALDAINMITINGTQYPMGRYPNATAPNKGYLTIDAHEGSTSITDNALIGVSDWTGSTLVMRINHWTLDYAPITAHSGATLTYSDPPSREPKNGFGYFIENHPATLDQFGEWYYNVSTKKLRMYFGAMPPKSYIIKTSTLENLVTVRDYDNITLDDLTIQGVNNNGFLLYSAAGITITNCNVLFSGYQGINAQQADNLNFTAENNVISDCGNFGINLRFAGKGQVVRNNSIRKIGLFPGMGGTGPQSRSAIISNALSGKQIEGNRIDSIGYAGIRFSGSDVIVQRNVVSNFTLVLDDGGGIYTGNQDAGKKTNRIIRDNLVYNGIGAKEGTPNAAVQQSSGIYVDDNASDIEIDGNTVWNCSKAGLYIHNAYNLSIHHNTFYNNAVQVEFTHDNAKHPTLTNVSFQSNMCFSKTATQPVANFLTRDDDIADFGTFDNNVYLHPPAAANAFGVITGVYQRNIEVKTKHTLESWHKTYGHDVHSKNIVKATGANAVRFEYNQTDLPLAIRLDKKYNDVNNDTYSGTVTLAPYTSLLLFPCTSCSSSISNRSHELKSNEKNNSNKKRGRFNL